MRVLVTGGAGFIGSHIVDLLIARGEDVAVLDDLSSGKIANLDAALDRCRLFVADICDAEAVERAFSSFRPDVVCHQAAQPSLRRSLDHPEHDAQINIVGTLNLIQAARRHGTQHFVMASTSAVYEPGLVGKFHASVVEVHGISEREVPDPNLPYGIAKMAAEFYLRHSGLSHSILRYGNVYGPRQVTVGENQLIPHCLEHLFRGAPFAIHGDGEQTRDFVYVGDIARANVMALEKRPIGAFNCGTGRRTSVNVICRELAYTAGQPYHRFFEHGPEKAGEMRHSVLNSLLAERAFGWRAETSLADGLALTVQSWREQVPA